MYAATSQAYKSGYTSIQAVIYVQANMYTSFKQSRITYIQKYADMSYLNAENVS